MNILGKLFGSEKVISGVVDGIDKVFYTDEEKAENFRLMLKLYEPFKIAQRFLALTFGVPYSLAWFITFGASFVVDVSAQLTLLSGTMGQIVLAIVAFYFLGGTLTALTTEGPHRAKM